MSRHASARLPVVADRDEAEPAPGLLAAEHHVVRDAEVRAEREVLIDRLDTGGACVLRAPEVNRPSLERHRARIGRDGAGDDLDQRRLAGAVVAKEADDLAPADGEVPLLERRERAVGFRRARRWRRPAAHASDAAPRQHRWQRRTHRAWHAAVSVTAVLATRGGSGADAARTPIATWSATSASKQHAADRDRLPPRLKSHEDQARIEDADRGDADGDSEWPSGTAGEGDAAQDRGGQHIELESNADGRRDAAEPAGDQHGDQSDEKSVDRVEADDVRPTGTPQSSAARGSPPMA